MAVSDVDVLAATRVAVLTADPGIDAVEEHQNIVGMLKDEAKRAELSDADVVIGATASATVAAALESHFFHPPKPRPPVVSMVLGHKADMGLVRSDRAYRGLGLRRHDYFVVKAIDRLRPGGLAAFVTSAGTMDKADRANMSPARRTHRRHSPARGRLQAGGFKLEAGLDVVVDMLFFRKRKPGRPEGDLDWLDLGTVRPASEEQA